MKSILQQLLNVFLSIDVSSTLLIILHIPAFQAEQTYFSYNFLHLVDQKDLLLINIHLYHRQIQRNRTILPASVDLTTDLHSMGQFIQDGQRTMFETVINLEESTCEVTFSSILLFLVSSYTTDFLFSSLLN